MDNMTQINFFGKMAKALLISIKLLEATPGNDHKAIKIKVVLGSDKITFLSHLHFQPSPPKCISVYQP